MNNRYGVDVSYNKKKLDTIIRDLPNYTSDELARELARLVVVNDPNVLKENEFKRYLNE